MPLIYITGPTGAGKTSVRNELLKRGYEAYDTDEGINEHFNTETGATAPYPNPKDVTAEWLSNHNFNLPKDKIVTLSKSAKDKLVFLCGGADNDLELADYFTTIICLVADKGVTKTRVENRTTNDYGKVPAEMDSILSNHDAIVQRYLEFGAIMIDTSSTNLSKVVDNILKATDDIYELKEL